MVLSQVGYLKVQILSVSSAMGMGPEIIGSELGGKMEYLDCIYIYCIYSLLSSFFSLEISQYSSFWSQRLLRETFG